jgi:hypothetical protein
MFSLNKAEHALITVYADTPDHAIENLIRGYIPDKEVKVLTPTVPDMLDQAAQNSVLTIIGLMGETDKNLNLVHRLKENRLVACDVIALFFEDIGPGAARLKPLSMGFDASLTMNDARNPDFKKFLMHKISAGARRLSNVILEEEYRRVCDALSAAPASIIIFDTDKRAVFISDHYVRAYPNIAPRLVRGLSVYDAFDMMAREEGLHADDPLFEKLQRYWYNLEGSIEFTLVTGVSYRLKAVQLPGRRGTVLMAQNITNYENIRTTLEEQAMTLTAELEKLRIQNDA